MKRIGAMPPTKANFSTLPGFDGTELSVCAAALVELGAVQRPVVAVEFGAAKLRGNSALRNCPLTAHGSRLKIIHRTVRQV